MGSSNVKQDLDRSQIKATPPTIMVIGQHCQYMLEGGL